MAIGCQGLCQSDLAHDHKARAISEREVPVAILEEQLTRLLEPFAVDALPAEPRAAIHLLPPRLNRAEAEPEPKKRQRFIDDVVRRDQRLTGFERSVARRAASRVGRIRRVGARHPARRVDEQRLHRP